MDVPSCHLFQTRRFFISSAWILFAASLGMLGCSPGVYGPTIGPGWVASKGKPPLENGSLPFWTWSNGRISKSVKRWKTEKNLDGEPGILADVRLSRVPGERGDDFGDIWFEMPLDSAFRSANWDTRFEVSIQVRPGDAYVNLFRSPRARIFVVDREGRRLYLPNDMIGGARPVETGGWITLKGRPTAQLPIPLGFTDEGFKANQIIGVGVNFEASGDVEKSYRDWIAVRRLRVDEVGMAEARRLPRDPQIIATEKDRAALLDSRWRQVFHTGLQPGKSVYGVNLAWAGAKAPDGQMLQLYGSFMEAPAPMFERYWDLARNTDVQSSVRQDFREIRSLFGPYPLVRIFLFADLRAGLRVDDAGVPIEFTETATESMRLLLQLAQEEQVVIMPVFFDFLMADGKASATPGPGNWLVGESPQFITDPEKRVGLVHAMGDWVAKFRGHPSLLAWDVMNEPENAVAVVTPEKFIELQTFLKEAVDAIQAHGEIATVGHRNPLDARDFFRGVIRTSLGQAHYYPWLETRPAPFGLGLSAASVFGDVPGGWGELPARKNRISDDFRTAREEGGHRFLLFWDWRGDDSSGDGFKVKAYSSEIRDALRRNASIPALFTMDDLPAWYVTDSAERLRYYQRYSDVFEHHALKGVLFVNSAGFESSDRREAEWGAIAQLIRAGHRVGNHGASHRPLSAVSPDEYWRDTQTGHDALTSQLQGWNASGGFYRFPNSEWGLDAESNCRRLQNEFHYQILPVTIDAHDYSYGKEYPFASSPAERDRLFQQALNYLRTAVRQARDRRIGDETDPSQAEIFLIHSTPFAFDHLGDMLEEGERLGLQWVAPQQADLSLYQPTGKTCVPACKIEEACR